MPSVERYRWFRAWDHDATSVSGSNRTEALCIDFGKRTRAGWRQPQAQKVSLALGLGIILERSAIVQDRVVVHELNVAGFQFHYQVELGIVGQFVEKIECLDLKRGEWRDAPKAPRRLDVLSLVNG